jgi:hypothetical protein
LQVNLQNHTEPEIAVGFETAAAHRKIEQHTLAGQILTAQCNRKLHFHPVIFASIFLDPAIPHTPLKITEALAAELALEGVDVE